MSTQRSRPKPASAPAPLFSVQAALSLLIGGQPTGGPQRLALLRAVAAHGSITQAAIAVGISYKSAWEAINALNALAGQPLVERSSGGRGGGGTVVTDHGRRLIERCQQVEAVHQRFVRLISDNAMDLDTDFSLLKVLNVKTSARNQWVGTVAAIRAGAVNDEVEVLMPGGARVAAVVTRESTDALGLRLKQTVIALVKSSSVLIATDVQGARVSARNRLEGRVTRVTPGAVNAEVQVQTDCGLPVVAIVTQGSLDALALQPGAAVTVMVQASDVLLATVTA